MINSKLNSNRLGDNGSGLPTYHKQPPVAIKKIPLRDVQNDNRSLLHSHTESEGGSIADAIKISGTKRLTPDCPQSPPCHQFFGSNGANDHLVYARRRFESELGKRRILDQPNKNADNLHSTQFCQNMQQIPQQQTQMKDRNVYCAPAFAPIPLASLVTFAFGEPSVPLSMGKPSNELLDVESNYLKVTSEFPHSVHSKETDDQQRKERFLHLQKVLKHCDEFDQNDYIQMLRSFSPSELSRHAIELEKRAIQLTVEEGKEIQRMKELNILEKSVPKNNPSPITQQVPAKK
ncbi:hypothetical protein PVL29_024087 [Vitis rotundifolia]|uniref:Uncharacterized protein n=1 Tax=Vitis rotundifolia TaxID=103349 RepID=A0AA39D8V1_VITRO|nr:hypothetical protein PVL29_024087 [Vitis rotundifolia]